MSIATAQAPMGQVNMDSDGEYKISTGNAWLPISNGGTLTTTIATNGISGAGVTAAVWNPPKNEEILDKFEMNQVVVEHKVAEHELMKLKADQPDYADQIKQALGVNATTKIIEKMTFTKKKNMDTDVNHFIGREWVFNKDEMETLIKEIRNA